MRRPPQLRPFPASPAATARRAGLDALRAVAHAAVASDGVDEALGFGLERLTAAVGGAFSAVFLVQPGDDTLRLAAACGWPDRLVPWLGALRPRVGEGPSGEAVAERRAIELPDVTSAAGIDRWRTVLDELDVRALAAFPMLVGGTPVGAATWYFREPRAYAEVDRDFLRTGADLLAMAVAVGRWRDRARRAEAALAEARTQATAGAVAPTRGASELAEADVSEGR